MCFPLQVSQGNVPGVESASLAMDTEEGVEVVWNEVLFSDKKVFKAQEVPYFFFLIQSLQATLKEQFTQKTKVEKTKRLGKLLGTASEGTEVHFADVHLAQLS